MKIATAQKTITPPKELGEYYLCGHAIRTEKAIGVLDDIVATAYVLDMNGEELVWISCELIGLSKEFSLSLIDEISGKYNVEKSNIMIGFTHTHSAPESESLGKFTRGNNDTIDNYMKWVRERVLQTVSDAMAAVPIEVSARVKTTEIDGFYGNRNTVENPGDKEFIELDFIDQNEQVVATILNFNSHPTVLGPQNLETSGDVAGFIRRYYQEKYGCYSLVMIGAAGNMSNRLYRQGNDYKELVRTGEGIITQIENNSKYIDIKMDSVDVGVYQYSKQFKISRQDKEENLKECERRISEATTFDQKKVYSSAKAFIESELSDFKTEHTLNLDCRIYKFDDITIVTVPAELFEQFGKLLKSRNNKKCTIIWGYTLYNSGYLYNKEEKGNSFESIASNIPSGTVENFIDLLSERM
ncbi:MAG: hypothetical protein ACK5LZ_06595 [Anaerorhabdus sp.]